MEEDKKKVSFIGKKGEKKHITGEGQKNIHVGESTDRKLQTSIPFDRKLR